MPLKFNKHEKVLTKKSKFIFGKYRGKKIGDVLLYDASYIVWACENIEWFKNQLEENIKNEAYEIYYEGSFSEEERDNLYWYDPYYD